MSVQEQDKIQHAFNSCHANSNSKLHPCVRKLYSWGTGYWLCHNKAMYRSEAMRWIAKEFGDTTRDREFTFLTPWEAWNPINWTFGPRGLVWTNDQYP